jgi:hypothetical protein
MHNSLKNSKPKPKYWFTVLYGNVFADHPPSLLLSFLQVMEVHMLLNCTGEPGRDFEGIELGGGTVEQEVESQSIGRGVVQMQTRLWRVKVSQTA